MAEGIYSDTFFTSIGATAHEQGSQSQLKVFQWLGATGGLHRPDAPTFYLLPSSP
ncbi:MAG: hypothetical protein KME25_18545 [Symplocastrum torsivum CPER-KK1]|uniref:Uncharacterized protein n=1 Tax=Symplocastrum torsivum CPER-KK1 TaxID=450513 RepID=A0A951PN53_9CYAN|nr:hypothetical protein [Symplocastrum torsivum CPER-KK1]